MLGRRRFISLLAIALVLGAGALFLRLLAIARIGFDGVNELAPIEEKYGSRHSSRNMEEFLIRDYFNDRRNGVFLDVGANHYQEENNTYFLETQLGWSGVAIDALREFADGYQAHRPRTKFFALFVSDRSDSRAQIFVPARNTLVASVDPVFARREGREEGAAREVPTTTLNHVLDHTNVSRLDLVSMDIELSEPKALAGFDIDRFKPALVCIEAHPEVRQRILNYFGRHQYVIVARYLRADPKNLYFEPLD